MKLDKSKYNLGLQAINSKNLKKDQNYYYFFFKHKIIHTKCQGPIRQIRTQTGTAQIGFGFQFMKSSNIIIVTQLDTDLYWFTPTQSEPNFARP